MFRNTRRIGPAVAAAAAPLAAALGFAAKLACVTLLFSVKELLVAPTISGVRCLACLGILATAGVWVIASASVRGSPVSSYEYESGAARVLRTCFDDILTALALASRKANFTPVSHFVTPGL